MRIVTDYKHAQQIIAEQDKRIAELEAKNAKLKAVRDAAIRLRNEVKGAIGMPGFCSLVGVTNITILQQRIDAVSGTVEAVESRSLAGRSRHSSAQGVICKPVAAESAQVATNRDRGAQPSLAAAKENE